MSLLITRVQLEARVRIRGKLGGSLPSDADLYATANEVLALWWSEMGLSQRSGIGRLTSTVTATAGQSYVELPAAQRHVREVYREDYEYPAQETTREEYGRPDTEPQLPGVWWYEYRATDGQVLELRPTPSTAETITVVGTGEPPSWVDDSTEVDLIDEVHYAAIAEAVRDILSVRDDPTRIQLAQQRAREAFRAAMGYSVPQRPTIWRAWLRPR